MDTPFSLAKLDSATTRVASEPADGMTTLEFCALCAEVSKALGKLGFAFSFAKSDVDTKHGTLVAASVALPTLAEVIAADVAAGTVRTSNHPTRFKPGCTNHHPFLFFRSKENTQ